MFPKDVCQMAWHLTCLLVLHSTYFLVALAYAGHYHLFLSLPKATTHAAWLIAVILSSHPQALADDLHGLNSTL
jgi:hypothetical protein